MFGDDDDAWLIMVFFFIVLVVVGLFLAWGIDIVNYNEYAIEREFGILKTDFKEPGFTWVGFGSLIELNNQNRNYEIKVESATKDLQKIDLDLNLNIKIKKEKTFDFIKNYQTEEIYIQYINNKIQEKVKTIILKYTAEEVLHKRIEISKEMYADIKQIDELDYFEFNDLAIKNIEFSDEFNAMIEKKAQVELERGIIVQQKQNLELLRENMKIMDIDTYFKYKLIEKWSGETPLIISDSLVSQVK